MSKTKNSIKVNHPEYGYVEFTMMSQRQMEILEHYKLLTSIDLNKIYNEEDRKEETCKD